MKYDLNSLICAVSFVVSLKITVFWHVGLCV